MPDDPSALQQAIGYLQKATTSLASINVVGMETTAQQSIDELKGRAQTLTTDVATAAEPPAAGGAHIAKVSASRALFKTTSGLVVNAVTAIHSIDRATLPDDQAQQLDVLEERAKSLSVDVAAAQGRH